MKIKIGLISIIMTLMLCACDTIKSYFPDKEKDYRYTNEIPALVVPPEINNQALAVDPQPPPVSKSAPDATIRSEVSTTPLEQATVQAESLDQKPVAQESFDQKPVAQEPVVENALLNKNFAAEVDDSDKAKVTEVVIVNEAGKTPELHVNQNLERTWRILGKALTRQAFEITERNTNEHYYLVQYDPEVTPMVDESIWDDVLFLFGAEKYREQGYRITLTEKDLQTTIKVLTKESRPCEDEKCTKLFGALQDAIQKALIE